MRRKINIYRVLVRNLMEGDRLEYLNVHRRIILAKSKEKLHYALS